MQENAIDRKKEISTNWNKYKHFRNKVNNLIKHAREQLFFANLERNVENLSTTKIKQYWKTLRQRAKTKRNLDTIL